MARHALLIGCPAHGLLGPVPDAERVADLLEPRGFDVHMCVDQDATRAGILAGYKALIDRAGSTDAIVVYYSGHGARALDEDYVPPNPEAPQKRYHQFIVPMDLDDSTDEDFRGILSLELSSLLTQLTRKTRNVSLIFDCCHSGGMTRDMGLRLKGLSKSWFRGASAHRERFAGGGVPGLEGGNLDVIGNPDAVRLMAALPSQSAWEWGTDEDAYGLLTDSLVTAFDEAGDRPVTWNHIKRRTRELVMMREPGQYPDVEGPSSRYVFELEEADLTGILPVSSTDDGPRLEGGRLFGIEVGDEYLIMPQGHQKPDAAQAISEATVVHVAGSWSLLQATPNEAGWNLPSGAQAFPTRRTQHLRPVVVRVEPDLAESFAAKLVDSGILRAASDDEADSPDVLATVKQSNGKIHIREKSELDLIVPLSAGPDAATQVIENLERLARARKLETLESGEGASALSADYELDWGRVVNGTPQRLERTGSMLFVGDHIYVRLRNKSAQTLYVSVFDIGLAGKITLLTRNRSPSGVELLSGEVPFTLGHREPFGWKGLGPLSWPDAVPKDGEPRPESLVVVISDKPQDLRALESPGMASPKGAEASRSDLERMVDQVATGRTRDLGVDVAPPQVRYAVEHIGTHVDPTESGVHVASAGATRGPAPAAVPAAAVEEVGGFLINDRPEASAVYQQQRRRQRGAPPPSAVAVQLGEIVVHKNRALLSADVRIDALVITGGAEADGTFRAGTAKFEGVKDGDRLPLDNLLVFHGPVHGFVDVAVWVSRDDKRALSLSDMLKEQVNGAEFKDAALVLAGLAVTGATAGAIVAGMGAATVVTNVAYKLLREAVGKSIGLYRTSFLSQQRFGAGRNPGEGTLRAQDFSFWYQVTEVE